MNGLPMDQFESRISELEVKLGFTEHVVDELNRTIARQQQQITLLQEELRMVFHQMMQLAPAGTGDPHEEIPPHY